MNRFVITVEASRDLEEISNYFLEKSLEAGDRFIKKFDRKCQYLIRFPYLGRSYAQLSPDLRGIALMDYIIFYCVLEDGIEIVRVLSGYRNFEEVFKN